MNRLEKLFVSSDVCAYTTYPDPGLMPLILKNCSSLREIEVDICLPAPAEGQKYDKLESLTCWSLADAVREQCPALDADKLHQREFDQQDDGSSISGGGYHDHEWLADNDIDDWHDGVDDVDYVDEYDQFDEYDDPDDFYG